VRRIEFHIFLSLVAGKRHGYGILHDIKARGDIAVPDVATMYRALARLEKSGLILATAPSSTLNRGGHRRIDYRITSSGTRLARAEARRLESLTRRARALQLLPEQ
jgi:DNA-binding PadR family transcriptional regulator